MKRLSNCLAGGAIAAAILAAPLSAGSALAEVASTVKIALLDMSAVATGPFGPGFGAAGPAPGFGMWGSGPGSRFGMMGRGGGAGMMGMMSIRADETTVKAGTVAFDITNWSRSIIHEVVVIAVDSPDAPLPYDYENQIVPETQVKMLGESEELEPNGSGTLELNLDPGSYLLVCNIPGHYAAGMVLPLTVIP